MELSTTVQAGSSSPHGDRPTPDRSWLFPVLGAVFVAFAASVWLRGIDARAEAGWIGLIAMAWSVPAFFSLRSNAPPWWALMLSAFVVRVLFVGVEPWLSDDVFRYLAEGRALVAGENPFTVPPAEMTSIPESLRLRVNHPDLPTLYPPLAQVWFRLLAVCGGTVSVAQGLGVGVDLAVVVGIARLSDRRFALLYALHPLGPLEVVLGAHIDGLAVALLVWACVVVVRRPWLAGLLTTMGGGVKLLPFTVVGSPPTRSRSFWLGAALGLVLCLLALVPVLDAGPALLTSMGTYSRHWSFNSLGLTLTTPLFGSWARPVLVVLGAAAWVWALVRSRSMQTAWLVIGIAFIAVTPTAHPWYLMWAFVPALACRRPEWAMAATPLLGSYAVLWTLDSPNGWQESPALWLGTWVPALMVLAVATWMRRRRPTR